MNRTIAMTVSTHIIAGRIIPRLAAIKASSPRPAAHQNRTPIIRGQLIARHSQKNVREETTPVFPGSKACKVAGVSRRAGSIL